MLDPTADVLFEQLRPLLVESAFPDRRLARILAFLALYEADLTPHATTQVLDRYAPPGGTASPGPAFGQDLLKAARRYAEEIIGGVAAHRSSIDRQIQERATAYPLGQMSAVDRNILRIGLYEALHGGARVPLRAAINEAVEMAKLFGSESSAKFVNGVLGKAVEQSTQAPRNERSAPGEPEARLPGPEPAPRARDEPSAGGEPYAGYAGDEPSTP